jgi:uncharacterized DUF497 family protein
MTSKVSVAFVGFDWDRGNREKCRKHGIQIEDIEALFDRPLFVFPDPAHSGIEERFKAIGLDRSGRYVFLIFTLRHRQAGVLVRPISARHMHGKEIAYYEKEAAEAAERQGR